MTLKILHLSDIHFRKDSEENYDPDALFRDQLVERVREDAEVAKFDCIFVTGDVAGRGAKAEYDVATRWLDDLSMIAGCGRAGIYVVPGNHDVDRAVSRDNHLVRVTQATLLNAATEEEREREFDRAMQSADTGPALFLPLEQYNNFAEQYECDIGPVERGRWTRHLLLDHGYRLKIFGLTSVLYSSCKPPGGDDEPRQNLYVGPFQTALRRVPGEIVVTLIHHPADWLLDSTRHNRALRNQGSLHFVGHVHDRDIDQQPKFMRFGAAAINPNRHEAEFEPGFNIVELDVVEDGPGFRLDIRARVWAWQDNPGQFRHHLNHDGDEVWTHSIKLKDIPKDAEPMVATDRLPPPPPQETGGLGPHIQKFWGLSGASKGRVANSLALLSDDERRLPERYRYTNLFARAKQQGKLDELLKAILAEGGE